MRIKERGFTVVELVVVMVIMAILVTLGMVSIAGSQAASRDRERQADAETLARGLEQRYILGNPKITSTPGNFTTAGGYPSVLEVLHIDGLDLTGNGFVPGQLPKYYEDALPGITISNRTAPGQAAGSSFRLYCFYCGGAAPEDATYISTTVTKDTYVYEPLNASNQQCNGEKCTRFNLYYRTEVDGALHTIRSKHQ